MEHIPCVFNVAEGVGAFLPWGFDGTGCAFELLLGASFCNPNLHVRGLAPFA